jgi:SpoVK/Ycf46/Vps4 family AAA+-type ATPase
LESPAFNAVSDAISRTLPEAIPQRLWEPLLRPKYLAFIFSPYFLAVLYPILPGFFKLLAVPAFIVLMVYVLAQISQPYQTEISTADSKRPEIERFNRFSKEPKDRKRGLINEERRRNSLAAAAFLISAMVVWQPILFFLIVPAILIFLRYERDMLEKEMRAIYSVSDLTLVHRQFYETLPEANGNPALKGRINAVSVDHGFPLDAKLEAKSPAFSGSPPTLPLELFYFHHRGSRFALAPKHGIMIQETNKHEINMLLEMLPELDRQLQLELPRIQPYLKQGWKYREAVTSRMQAEAKLKQAQSLKQQTRDLVRPWEGFHMNEQVLSTAITNIMMFKNRDPAAPSWLLFDGPSGTGKSKLGSILAETSGCKFLIVGASDVKAAHVGGSEEKVRELWERARAQAPCILFIDECHALFPSRSIGNADKFATSITDTFLYESGAGKNNSGVLVIGASSRPEGMDPDILSRFGTSIHIPLPDAEAREGILRDKMREYAVDAPVTPDMVKQTQGFSGRALEQLCKELRRKTFGKTVTNWPAEIEACIRAQRTSGSTAVDTRSTWENLILPDDQKRRLKAYSTLLRNAATHMARGFEFSKVILLAGPPGTGKTEVARTMANESGLYFETAGADNLLASYEGQTAKLVSSVFERARSKSPSVLFIDEVDKVIPKTGAGGKFADQALGQIQKELDGVKSDPRPFFVIMATNYLDRLEGALKSRVGETFIIDLPTTDALAKILERNLRSKPLDFNLEPEFLHSVALKLQGRSGRDVANLVRNASMESIIRSEERGDPDNAAISRDDIHGALATLLLSKEALV